MASKLFRLWTRLPTYWTYVRENPRWLVVLLCGRVLAARRLERRWHRALPTPLTQAPPPSRLVADRPELIVGEIERAGASHRIALSTDDVQAIRAFAEATPCTTRAQPVRSFLVHEVDSINADRPRDVIAAYYFEKVRDCPQIVALEQDPLILALSRAYIGAPPQHIRTRLWWSFPGHRVAEIDLHSAAQNKFHFDLNGFRTIKFFFYLTDVDLTAGPHAYVAGSHNQRKLSHQYTLMVGHDEQELRDYYGDERFIMVTGKAGTGFVEDPFVFHVGMMCETRPRLLLEMEFAPFAASASYRHGVLG